MSLSRKKKEFLSACKKEKGKIGRLDVISQISPIACKRLFPYQITMILFTVTKRPTDSIICFVKAHLSLDTFIIGAT
jgi:hypothetical protein